MYAQNAVFGYACNADIRVCVFCGSLFVCETASDEQHELGADKSVISDVTREGYRHGGHGLSLWSGPKGLLTFLGSLYEEGTKTTSGTLVHRLERLAARKKKILPSKKTLSST